MTITLLALDDSTTMRHVIEMTFAGPSYEVIFASCTQEARDAFAHKPPQLVLLDVGIGSEDGYILCQELKSQAPEIPIILMPSQHAPLDPTRAQAADGHIDKPFDSETLLQLVAQLVVTSQRGTPTTTPEVELAPPTEPPALLPTELEPLLSLAQPITHQGTSNSTPANPTSDSRRDTHESRKADLNARLAELGLSAQQITEVFALCQRVIATTVSEVVPVLAEKLIREEIDRLTSE